MFKHMFTTARPLWRTVWLTRSPSPAAALRSIFFFLFFFPIADAGIHFKAPQPRGGSIHSIKVINSQFHLETSTKMQMPFSASMFYGGSSGPAPNASATPQVLVFLCASIFMQIFKDSFLTLFVTRRNLVELGGRVFSTYLGPGRPSVLAPFLGGLLGPVI